MPQQSLSHADLLICPRWVVPVEPAGAVLEHHAVVVNGNRIAAVLPREAAASHFRAARVIERPGHILLPGLVNAHTHAASSLLRGGVEDLPARAWLTQYARPAGSRWLGPEFVRDGTRLAMLEMLRNGTTCFNDMYYFPDVVAALAVEHHMRVSVSMIISGQPSAWAQNTDECFDRGVAVHDQYRDHDLVQTSFAAWSAQALDDAALRHLRLLAGEIDVPVHMHVHHSAAAVRPLERLERFGLLEAGFMAVDATGITDEDLDALVTARANVIHCPAANLASASGLAPVARFLAAGINVALGTDAAAASSRPDMFAEMHLASLLAKTVARDPGAVPAGAALEMATLAGARALGLGEQLGSLVPGKLADMICIDADAAGARPVHDVIAQLVHATSGTQVTDSWIGGRQVLAGGQPLFFDEAAVVSQAAVWQPRLASA